MKGNGGVGCVWRCSWPANRAKTTDERTYKQAVRNISDEMETIDCLMGEAAESLLLYRRRPWVSRSTRVR